MVLVTGYVNDHNGAMRVIWKLVAPILSGRKIKLLFESEDNRKNFEREAPKHNLLLLHGHGFEWCVTGRLLDPKEEKYESIYDIYNYNIISGKTIYAFACESASLLGYKSAEAGNTYIGFVEPLVFPLDIELARICLGPFVEFEKLLLDGVPPEEAYETIYKSFLSYAPREADPEKIFAYQTMIYNLGNFIIVRRGTPKWESIRRTILGFLGGFAIVPLVLRIIEYLKKRK